MKRIRKSPEPPRLAAFRQRSPQADWEACKRNRERRLQIQQTLMQDQGGLCAYCEIDLRQETSPEQSDFRIDHFHPKSDDQEPVNWALAWTNLLACCHGGSREQVLEAGDRFESEAVWRTCDIPKGEQNLEAVILNPLQIPAFPALFRCTSSGVLVVDDTACRQAGVDPLQAQATLDRLNLCSPRLNRLRRAQIDQLRTYLQRAEQQGQSLDEARRQMARRLLGPDSQGGYSRFFTALRSYLGTPAEQWLQETGYDG